jgi:hypothetical protein
MRGCAILGALAKGGAADISRDFLVWDDEFHGLPTAERYPLWDPEALKQRLTFVEGLRDQIVAAAQAILGRLK